MGPGNDEVDFWFFFVAFHRWMGPGGGCAAVGAEFAVPGVASGSGVLGEWLLFESGFIVGVCRFYMLYLVYLDFLPMLLSVPASCHCDRCFCYSPHAVRSTYTSVRLERLLHLPLRSCACAVYCCVCKQNAVHAANLSEHVLYYHVWCVPDVPGMCTLHTRGTEPFFLS
jgi:hypothetical protein